jgi:hypothetical protein
MFIKNIYVLGIPSYLNNLLKKISSDDLADDENSDAPYAIFDESSEDSED